MEKYQKLPYNLFWNQHCHFLILFQLTTRKKSPALPSLQISDLWCAFFFSRLVRLLYMDGLMKSEVTVLVASKIFRIIPVCNFQSMKSPMKLNSLWSKFFYYITCLLYQLVVISLDDLQTRLLHKILLLLGNNSLTIKNYQLILNIIAFYHSR